VVAAYNAVEIQALLDATIQKELEVLQFFLFTGAREQEGPVCHLARPRPGCKDVYGSRKLEPWVYPEG